MKSDVTGRLLMYIYNPKSGRGHIGRHLSVIVEKFVQSGYQVLVHPTQCRGDATDAVIHRDPEVCMVVCGGGDGTLDEVVKGMMKSAHPVPIGYIPSGSTNDFARSLGIPLSVPKAAATAVEGRAFSCDIGNFNGDVFVYVAAFGMFTDVSYDTDQHMKNLLGHMAYIIEGAKRLPTVTSYHYRIGYTDENGEEQELEDDYLLGMVTNSKSVGGFKNITGRKILMDDGVFEVTLIRKPLSPIEYMAISDAIDSRNADTGLIVSFKASKITFEADEPVAWTLDGEFGGEYEKVAITNRNKALSIMIPQE